MIKYPFIHQQKQKILNYEIKMIQECRDSLFNQINCNHDRYLQWSLFQNIQQYLENYQYTIRWMGNDQNSYIYAYSFIVIIGCSGKQNLIIQLKTVLYELAQKYLAQFQQKLLVEFLCLIEYSQDRFMFFRKYPKVQSLLVKIFKQIEQREPKDQNQSMAESKEQKNPLSKLTTCITSPNKSKNQQFRNTFLRSSYQSHKLRLEGDGKMNNKDKINKRSQKWYYVYNRFFNFIKMMVINDQNVRFYITSNPQNLSDAIEQQHQDFIISFQKGCVFVFQLQSKNVTKKNNSKASSQKNKTYSVIQESKEYLNQLLYQQIKQSNMKNDKRLSNEAIEHLETQFTPKFISTKKKISLVEDTFYGGNVNKQKSIQVEVLDLNSFDDDPKEISQLNIQSNFSCSNVDKVFKKRNTGDYIPLKANKIASFNNCINSNQFQKTMRSNMQKTQKITNPQIDKFAKRLRTETVLSPNNSQKKIPKHLSEQRIPEKIKKNDQNQINEEQYIPLRKPLFTKNFKTHNWPKFEGKSIFNNSNEMIKPKKPNLKGQKDFYLSNNQISLNIEKLGQIKNKRERNHDILFFSPAASKQFRSLSPRNNPNDLKPNLQHMSLAVSPKHKNFIINNKYRPKSKFIFQ